MEKKLKGNKSRITLEDGTELQHHLPRPFVENPMNFKEQLPAEALAQNQILELEIGCGKGEFLAREAALHPERFYVGIDRRNDRYDLSCRKVRRLENSTQRCLVLDCDARAFDSSSLVPIDVMHVYHPDPWPKSRHHKHRFWRSPRAQDWTLAIKSGGYLRFSSDHREYFEEFLSIAQSWGHLKLQAIAVKRREHGNAPNTHFEGIFLRQGLPVYKVVYRRV